MATLARHCSRFWHPYPRLHHLSINRCFLRNHSNDHHHHHHDDQSGHKLYAQHLDKRALVEISGTESRDFLQGLISSDMSCFEHTEESTSLYAGMLNPQGRLLYDLILYNMDQDTYWAECDAQAVDEIMTILKRHRLRKKIGIENMSDGIKIWSLFRNIYDTEVEEPEFIDQKFNLAFAPDPRIKNFGWRLLLPEHTRMENTVRNAHELIAEDLYSIERYKVGLPEGVEELVPGKAFPLESNFNFLNGVSFTKGCYVGQELTARTHHTGVTRKRLVPVKFTKAESVEVGDKIKNDKGRDIGSVRAVKDHYGLALLRIGNLTGSKVRVLSGEQESEASVSVPSWWPLSDDEFKKIGFTWNPEL